MNQRDADVIVVGSGFGGAVTACRLSQAGAKVLLLERGRRWTTATYPRAVDDPWLRYYPFDTAVIDKLEIWSTNLHKQQIFSYFSSC